MRVIESLHYSFAFGVKEQIEDQEAEIMMTCSLMWRQNA